VKFLVDAQLPPKLCEIIESAGFSAMHVEALPAGDETKDQEIIDYADKHQLIVITKDIDFYHSHMILGKPEKLFLITTGNIRNKKLFNLIRMHSKSFKKLLDNCHYIELSDDGIYGSS